MGLYCPHCKEAIWDAPVGHKLAKCWNCGVASDCPLVKCPDCDELTVEENEDGDMECYTCGHLEVTA